ncbi:MAG: GNAT family N-acetyltransferase [Deltaproteobacteria bacterium]|nr:MAG: GNAT family N-acetyltransferase [Deltaproteobacteria bacterium]
MQIAVDTPKMPPVSDAIHRELARCEVLAEAGRYRVLAAHGPECPAVMQEVGRLRTEAFRAAGMGATTEIDLDRYDDHYMQLLLVDDAAGAIIGGYRLGWCSDLFDAGGLDALYSSSLFDFDERMVERMRSAAEVGRSFIHPTYHRQLKTLVLLWRGIGAALAKRPGSHVLFGSVSISTQYSERTRSLILSTLREHVYDDELADSVVASNPPRLPLVTPADDMPSLDRFARAEDGLSVPILLKKYARLGGRFIGFNVDEDFGDSIDALVWVDLRDTKPDVLAGYVGEHIADQLQGRA